MLQLNAAQLAQISSKTLGMVLFATCDMSAGSLNFHKLDALKDVSRGSIDELRYSGQVTLVADSTSIEERDALRAAMQKVDIELDDDQALGAEIMLFDKGELLARAVSQGVTPSDLL